MLTEIENTN